MNIDLTRRYNHDGLDLAWDRWGDAVGTPLVLCHGFTGSAADFGLQVPMLSSTRSVFALDHRGHGLSTNVGDAAAYGFSSLAADLAAWIAAKVGPPVDLLGHSMGGRLALDVALDHPELVRSLILMDTSAHHFVTDSDAAAMMQGFLGSFDPIQGLPAFVWQGMGPEQELIEGCVDATFLHARGERSAATDPWAFKALGLQLSAPDLVSLVPRLAEIDVPVTVIVGSEDHPLVDLAPELAAAANDAALVVIEGAYHSPQLTHPEEWRAAVEGHFARF